MTVPLPSEESIRLAIARAGHVFVPASAIHSMLGELSDWNAFAASWDDMPLDRYLAEASRFRRRRYAMFDVSARGALKRKAHGPHLQGQDYNKLFGGVARWFEPILDPFADGPSLHAILRYCTRVFGAPAPAARWHVEVHQFRIEARAELPGQPTPEGVHRDGVDYVLVLLVRRRNIASGTTTIHTPEGKLLGSFTLTEPLDATLVDDHRVYHGVTPVVPVDAAEPAYRDVLVVTFRREDP